MEKYFLSINLYSPYEKAVSPGVMLVDKPTIAKAKADSMCLSTSAFADVARGKPLAGGEKTTTKKERSHFILQVKSKGLIH